MRQLVRKILDDEEDESVARHSNADIDDALLYAAQNCAQSLADAGRPNIISFATVNIASGLGTIPANDGIRSISTSNGYNSELFPVGSLPLTLVMQVSFPITIEYIAKTTLPALTTDIFTYAGQDINDPTVDRFTAFLAAYTLQTTEGSANPQIEKNLALLESQVNSVSSPSIEIMPMQRYVSAIRYYYAVSGAQNTAIKIVG